MFAGRGYIMYKAERGYIMYKAGKGYIMYRGYIFVSKCLLAEAI